MREPLPRRVCSTANRSRCGALEAYYNSEILKNAASVVNQKMGIFHCKIKLFEFKLMFVVRNCRKQLYVRG